MLQPSLYSWTSGELRCPCSSQAIADQLSLDASGSRKMEGALLGHTQVQTTARYAHLASDPVKHAATKISDRLALAYVVELMTRTPKMPSSRRLTMHRQPDDEL